MENRGGGRRTGVCFTWLTCLVTPFSFILDARSRYSLNPRLRDRV